MTVPSQSSSQTYTGNGATTDFSTVWRARLSSQIKVTVTPDGGSPSVKTLGVDYTVPDAPSDGSSAVMTVRFGTAPEADAEVLLERDVSFTQDTSFRTQGSFSPKVHEDSFDESVFRDQELDRRVTALEGAGAGPGGDPVVAGDGLAYTGGDTLNVVVGPGLIVGTEVEVDFGTAGSLGVVSVAAATAGTTDKSARIDHTHLADCAAPSTGSVASGNVAAEGTSDYLARADHVHPVEAPTDPEDVYVQTADPGSSDVLAREDHVHNVVVGTPVELDDDTSDEGNATSLARSDHVHSHGERGGGALHDDATTTVSGFMSSSDKVKLDALAEETVTQNTVQTVDAVAKQLMLFTPTNETAEYVDLTVVGRKTGGVDSAGYRRGFVVRRYDNTTSLIGSVQTIHTDQETDSVWDITVSVVSPNVIVTVTGKAATTIEWAGVARRLVAVAGN